MNEYTCKSISQKKENIKKVLLCARMPHNNSYVGGVVSILYSYLNNKLLFEKNGCKIEIFDYQLKEKLEKYNSKLKNIIYFFQQRKALINKLKEDPNVILNIHTSRDFLFLKDILLAKMANRKFHTPVIISIHVGDFYTVFNRIGIFQKYLISCMNKYIDKVIFLSKKIESQFKEVGLEPSKAELVYNFYDLDLDLKEKKLIRNSKLHLIFIGAIHREKGIIELLTALTNLNDIDFHLDLCGQLTDTSIENQLKELIEKLNNKVTIHGYVKGDKKSNLLQRADILILPSYHEGMPLVILEALATGCAIISTKVGATPEILDENNVIWTETKSYNDIEVAIRKLYNTPEILKKMQKMNLNESFNYTLENNIIKLCKIYSELEK